MQEWPAGSLISPVRREWVMTCIRFSSSHHENLRFIRVVVLEVGKRPGRGPSARGGRCQSGGRRRRHLPYDFYTAPGRRHP